jgi:hypothetical protein
MKQTPILSNLYFQWYIFLFWMVKFISTNCLPNLYIYLWPEKWQNHATSFSEITMENDWWLLILRNHSQWEIVQWSRRSWKSCIPVIYLFLKVSQCKLKEKETILMLGNALKSKSKIGLGASTSTLYQGFTLNPLGAFWLSAKFSLRL